MFYKIFYIILFISEKNLNFFSKKKNNNNLNKHILGLRES